MANGIKSSDLHAEICGILGACTYRPSFLIKCFSDNLINLCCSLLFIVQLLQFILQYLLLSELWLSFKRSFKFIIKTKIRIYLLKLSVLFQFVLCIQEEFFPFCDQIILVLLRILKFWNKTQIGCFDITFSYLALIMSTF